MCQAQGQLRSSPFPLGALNPGEQVSYSTVTEAAEMRGKWQDAMRDTEGAPNLPCGAQGNFCKEVASQLSLQKGEELAKKGQKLFQEQNGAWHIWGLKVLSLHAGIAIKDGR